jgi:ParB-like chromosome segregation protein Spo0J
MLVPIAEIRVGQRLRRARPEQVAQLATSITAIGLRTPISVFTGVTRIAGGGNGVTFELVAGLHRLEACRSLGHQEIEAQIVQMNADETNTMH